MTSRLPRFPPKANCLSEGSALDCFPKPHFDNLVYEAHEYRDNKHLLPMIEPQDIYCRITAETLARVLNCEIPDLPPCIVLVLDIRFFDEFKEGHIQGARHISSVNQLSDIYCQCQSTKAIIIFHCEFSTDRSVKMMDIFRDIDRRNHVSDFPSLSFPDVYLLKGGFKEFHCKFPKLCEGRYISMRSIPHKSIYKQAFDSEIRQYYLNQSKTPPARQMKLQHGIIEFSFSQN